MVANRTTANQLIARGWTPKSPGKTGFWLHPEHAPDNPVSAVRAVRLAKIPCFAIRFSRANGSVGMFTEDGAKEICAFLTREEAEEVIRVRLGKGYHYDILEGLLGHDISY